MQCISLTHILSQNVKGIQHAHKKTGKLTPVKGGGGGAGGATRVGKNGAGNKRLFLVSVAKVEPPFEVMFEPTFDFFFPVLLEIISRYF